MRAIILSPVLLVVLVTVALAADDTTIQLAAWVALVKPYLDLLVPVLINVVIVPAVVYGVWKVTGVQLDRRYSDQMTKLLTNQAAGLVASGAAKVSATGAVDVHSLFLKQAADELISFAPEAIKWFGYTPERVEATIVQKIPQLPVAAGAAAVQAG